MKKIADSSRKFCSFIFSLVAAFSLTVVSFASTEDYVVIQSTDMAALIDAAKDNIAVVIPVGVALLAISFGIGFALNTLKKFKRG